MTNFEANGDMETLKDYAMIFGGIACSFAVVAIVLYMGISIEDLRGITTFLFVVFLALSITSLVFHRNDLNY